MKVSLAFDPLNSRLLTGTNTPLAPEGQFLFRFLQLAEHHVIGDCESNADELPGFMISHHAAQARLTRSLTVQRSWKSSITSGVLSLVILSKLLPEGPGTLHSRCFSTHVPTSMPEDMRVMSAVQTKSADLLDSCLWRFPNPMGQGCRHQRLRLRGNFILSEKASPELILYVQGISTVSEFCFSM